MEECTIDSVCQGLQDHDNPRNPAAENSALFWVWEGAIVSPFSSLLLWCACLFALCFLQLLEACLQGNGLPIRLLENPILQPPTKPQSLKTSLCDSLQGSQIDPFLDPDTF